ncbi:hypothetical protein B0H11DRAFT_2071241 [Mycena galericulata]|nr:hypothetical protein B0H11DRAFT_2071241 [Mycena galericulata]
MVKSEREDILLTGFTRGPHSIGVKIDEFGETESELDLNSSGSYQEPTICLELLKTMITTVLDTESDCKLLTSKETAVLVSFQHLSLHAQHLFVFLVIHPKWHRLGSLKLVDIPVGDVSCAIEELCRRIPETSDCEEPHVKTEETEMSVKLEERVKTEEAPIDLSESVCIKQEQCETKPELLPCGIPGPSNFKPEPSTSTLFPLPRPESNPPSLCITDSVMTLRQLVEYMELDDLRITAKDLKIKAGKKRPELIDSILETSKTQTNLTSFFAGKGKGKPSSQEDRLRAMIMKRLQKLVRVDPGVFDILIRARILYSRCTQYPTEILARPLRHLKRKYPDFVHARNLIWKTREMFREYEAALRAEAILDGVLPSGIVPDPEPLDEKNIKGKRKSRAVDAEVEVKDRKAAAVRKAEVTVKLFNEIYQRWVYHLALATKGARETTTSERFEPGYVLTRAVHRGVKAFRLLNQPEHELAVLDSLLKQTFWCTGLRGPWHIRQTVILVKMATDAGDTEAISACMVGLQDSYTGLIYRPTLIRMLAKLQKRASTPPEEQINAAEPAKIPRIVFHATRIPTDEKKRNLQWRAKDGEEGPLETLISQHYEGVGFKRIMPGGSVFTTLFAFLFWDILFLPVDGAFATHYQTCPLDLCEDGFLATRNAAIAVRLSEIAGGKAAEYLRKHAAEHRDAKPCAVGVRWDLLCPRKDLTSVLKCIPHKTLATICEMFCQDYVGGCVGAPDLVAWDVEDGSYKLVYIKAPGYSSGQGQKACRDVLARGCADQEICEVTDGKKKKRTGKKKAADSDSDTDRESEDDELDPESEDDDDDESGRARSQASKKLKRARQADEDEDHDYRPKTSKKRKTSE